MEKHFSGGGMRLLNTYRSMVFAEYGSRACSSKGGLSGIRISFFSLKFLLSKLLYFEIIGIRAHSIWRSGMEKPPKNDSFKIQNKYRQKVRRKRKNNNKFEVIIIAIIFLTIIIVKWLD
jgi:hypothetical protein